MKKYGLIGYPLSHSFSPEYFTEKFRKLAINADYQAYPLTDIKQFPSFIEKHQFAGLNVTIPYKEVILPFLDIVSDEASAIGAVNTLHFSHGCIMGYNTDVIGFEQSLLQWIYDFSLITGALILGTGGASKAVAYVLSKLKIPFQLVSRTKSAYLHYDTLSIKELKRHNLIINTTPLGMSPDLQNKPKIPYEWLNEKYFLYDLVYNPEKTLFLTEGLKKGCRIKNGFDMLVLQAEAAWNIWNQ